MRARSSRGDTGAVLVIVALSLVALLGLTGLVVDGGNAYSQRRQMQNAADASALAGANALQRYRSTTPKPAVTTIFLAARTKATENGALSTPFTCDLVYYDASGSETGASSCPTTTGSTIATNAYKVRVTVSSNNATYFMGALGASSFTARGTAAASIERAHTGEAVFMVCANAAGHPQPLLLVPDPLHPENATINPAAVGLDYEVWGNAIKSDGRDCGNPSSSYRGLIDNGAGPFTIPGWWEADQGNKGGHVGSTMTTGCSTDNTKIKDLPVGCELALPLCLQGNTLPGNGFAMSCVSVGRFRVSDGGHGITATFIGGGVATGGEGVGIPGLLDLVVLKLSE
jgi:Flp pilus assembly protein TadG